LLRQRTVDVVIREKTLKLSVRFDAAVARTDLEDYVQNLEIAVMCFDQECATEYVVAKLVMDRILWADAQVDGVSLFEVCDNDSQGMHELHVILTKGKQEFRRDLKIDEVTNHVIFLYRAVFHPAVHLNRQSILDTAFKLFGRESLAVMWQETSGLSDAELADLGFRKVASSQMVYRHSASRTNFEDRHPKGLDNDVDGVPEYEQWVIREWKRLDRVNEPEEGKLFGHSPD
jgi:hypothetical protein